MRTNGYYLVVFQNEKYIGRFIGSSWTLPGNVNIYYDEDFSYIGNENFLKIN